MTVLRKLYSIGKLLVMTIENEDKDIDINLGKDTGKRRKRRENKKKDDIKRMRHKGITNDDEGDEDN